MDGLLMQGQRGSALVTVVGLSVVLTLAAGGLLGTVAVSQGEEDAAWKRLGCFHDVESGLMLGIGWLRETDDWDTYADFESTHTLENGCVVKVTVRHSGTANTSIVEARSGFNGDSISLAWNVTGSSAKPRTLSLSAWRRLGAGGP